MNIHWFSPLPPSRSGIALHTGALVPELAKHGRLTLWTDQDRWDPRLGEMADVRQFRAPDFPWPELNRADVVVYNLGNHPLHEGAWEISRQHSGIVILHDLCMHQFFAEVFLTKRGDPARYSAEMERWYGKLGREAAERCIAAPSCIADAAARFPLRELAAGNALGVVVHTPGACQTLAREGLTPAVYLPLPSPYEMAAAPAATGAPQGPPYRIIAFGLFGSNRRLGSVFEAWAALERPDLFRMDICGEFLDVSLLESLKRSPVSKLVTYHGYVPEGRLHDLLSAAHLAVNLRWPSVGEASGTQLLIWQHALPALVTKTGWYASCPAGTVAFVRPEEEIADIQGHLRAFLEAPGKYRRMGECGREYVHREHSSSRYVEELLRFAEIARRGALRRIRLRMADRAAEEMLAWVPEGAAGSLLDRVSAQLSALAEPAARSHSAGG